jgi:hypothetical protein
VVDVPCVRVRRTGERWGVTQRGLGWFLAEFVVWQDAIDYARGLAAASRNSILEGEDSHGRLTLRQVLSTDASGVIHVQSVPLKEAAAGYKVV